MRLFLDQLYRSAGLLAAASLAGIALIVLSQIFGRWAGIQVKSADEIAGYFLAASLFLALAPTLRSGDHIRVELLKMMLAPAKRHLLDIAGLTVAALMIGYFAYSAIDMVLLSHEINDVSQGLLPIPLWIPQTAMALGLVVLLIALLDDLVAALAGRPTSYARAAEARSRAGDVTAFER